MERRLLAILAADVVGYSRLMEQDEAGTFDRLRLHRKELFEPEIAQHRGRIFKLMGDGILAEFASALDAVECATALQAGMAARNRDVPPDRRISLRIGISLGDVIVEGDDRHGEGVNLAARLQASAEPDGICISGNIHDQVRGKLRVAFEDIGPQTLKNIAGPVQAYLVRSAPEAGHPSPAEDPSSRPGKPSVAVLPFDNLSADPEQQYFSDGMTEDIITELARFRQLLVIARNSSFQYRDKAVDVKRMGRELGAAYVVEGSVRRTGNRVRITAQLVETATGNHLWAERYDCDLEEVFALQDEVVRTIVGTLVGRLQAASVELMKRTPPKHMAAYDYVLRGNALPVGSPKDEAEARRLFEKAIEIDPQYGLAHALLVAPHMLAWSRKMSSPAEGLDEILEMAKRAVALDEHECVCQMMLGWVYLHRRSYSLAEAHYRRALELNPNKPVILAHMCEFETYMGRPEEGIALLERARRIDPFHPNWYWRSLGRSLCVARRHEEALAAFARSTVQTFFSAAYAAACQAHLGANELAKKAAAVVLEHQPDFSIRGFIAKEPLKRASDLDHLVDGLRKSGLPE